MKRLRFFAVITILLFSFAYGFISPQKAFAQTSPVNTAQSNLTAGTNLFTEEIRILSAPNLTTKIGADSVAALIKEVNYAKSIFIGLYNSEIQSKKTPDNAFKTALNSVQYTVSTLSENGKYGDSNLILTSAEKNLLNGNSEKEILTNFTTILGVAQPTNYINLSPNVPSAQLVVAQNAAEVTTGAKTSAEASLSNAAAVAAAAKDRDATLAAKAGSKCYNLVTSNFSDCLDAGVAWLITHTLLAMAGWFLWITATMMNYAIQIGILNFSQWAPSTLYPIWIIVRQIVSLFIVFAGLWLGFMYIINKGKEFEKYIPWVVIFALFVNFSYPLTRTVIDISNIVSLNIYASAVGSDALNASTISVSADKTAGTIIMNRLGLVGLVDFATGDGNTTKAAGKLNAIDNTPGALLAVIFIAYAAWIFFMVSALIITRTAVLVFLIVASPLLFVDTFIPKLGEQAAKLRTTFWEMLFVGPVFAIMLALTLKFLEVFELAGGPLSEGSKIGAGSGQGAVVMFFNILMMLIMLHIMLKVTKATSGAIGKGVSDFMGKVGGVAVGGVALGGAGMLGRATVGRGAAALRDSNWVSSNQGNFVGRGLKNMSSSVAMSNFDARNSSFVRTQAGNIGMSLGVGGKMGYEQTLDAKIKDREERLSSVGTHRRNVYDVEGKIIHNKGDLDTSAEAVAARKKYIGNAGSALFNTANKNDMKLRLEEARDKEKRSQKDKIMSDYNSFDTTAEGKLKKSAFLKMQDQEKQKELIESDVKKALAEYKGFEDTLAGRADKLKFYNEQNPETQGRLDEYKNKTAIEKIEKDAEKAEKKSDSAATIATNQKVADQLEAVANGLKNQSNQGLAAASSSATGTPSTSNQTNYGQAPVGYSQQTTTITGNQPPKPSQSTGAKEPTLETPEQATERVDHKKEELSELF